MSDPVVFVTRSPEETEKVGERIAALAKPGDVLCLTGEPGAGKTTLVKGIAEAFAGIDPSSVTSPTFSYLNIYSGTGEVYHFDLYRFSSEKEFLKAGFFELLRNDALHCIEWPDKIPRSLPIRRREIKMEYLGSEIRKITFGGTAETEFH